MSSKFSEEFKKSFLDEIKHQEEIEKNKPVPLTMAQRLGRLYSLIPIHYQNRIARTIDKHHKGDSEEYIKTIPLFMKKFNREYKEICDDNSYIEDKRLRRQHYKVKRQTKLWCSHLLALSGARTGENYIENILFAQFVKSNEEKEEMSKRIRLMSTSGKLFKILSPEQKMEQERMKTKRQLKVLDLISSDRGDMTWTFGTITLPPSYHSSPVMGISKYDGCKPQDVIDKINFYWENFRTALKDAGFKFGTIDGIYGIKVFEGHKDGCLHLHFLLHHKKSDTDKIHKIFERRRKVAQDDYKKENPDFKKSLQWQLKLNNQKSTATNYVCKYIFPEKDENGNYKKGADRNIALRHFYGVRAYAFFGTNECISMFEFLCSNFNQIPEEIVGSDFYKMLKDRDLYKFQSSEFLFCKKIHSEIEIPSKADSSIKVKKEIFLGVEYINPLNGLSFIYRKKQNAVIENFISSDAEIIHLSDDEIEYGLLDMKKRAEYNWELMEDHHCSVVKKQNHYNTALLQYLMREVGKPTKDLSVSKKYYIPEILDFTSTYDNGLKVIFDRLLDESVSYFKNDRKEEFLKEFNPKIQNINSSRKPLRIMTQEEKDEIIDLVLGQHFSELEGSSHTYSARIQEKPDKSLEPEPRALC